MSIVSATDVRKAYGERVVLSSVSFTISAGERVGVVGRNGAGKSTFARILAGREEADSGTVATRRDATVVCLDQVPKFEGNPTAIESVESGLAEWKTAFARYEALSGQLAAGDGDQDALLEEQAALGDAIERLGGWDMGHVAQAMLSHVGITRIDGRVRTMSGGEQRRVALAKALIARPDLLVMDEPTNHLDADTIEWLETFLVEEYGRALLLITHDRYLLDRVAQRTVEIADGEAFSYDGGYELYLEQKAERAALAQRTEQNRQNFLRTELDWLRRQPKARGTKQKARIERAETAIGMKKPVKEQTADLRVDVARTGKTILEARDLSVAIGGQTLVNGLTLYLTEGERLGVIGRNGTGKTTLLRALLGQLGPEAGTVTIGRNTKIAYFDQMRTDLKDDETIFDNVMGDQTFVKFGDEVIQPYSYLGRFAFDKYQLRQTVGSLSGGERARVALARLLRQSANLFVLDEPTNDLDVATLAAMESMLVDYGLTALIVTHDRWFLDRVATSILAFESGDVTQYQGNYSTFRRLRQARLADKAAATTVEAPAPKSPQPKPVAAKPKKLSFKERKELEGLPAAIELAESQVAALTEQLADPAIYRDGADKSVKLTKELEAARAEAEQLTERWMELEERDA